MLRLFLVSIWVTFAPPASAATVPFWTADLAPRAEVSCDPFQDVLDAHELSYRDTPGTQPLPLLQMSVQLPLLIGLGWWIALILPRQRSQSGLCSSGRLRSSRQIPDSLDHRA
jgi:hypothetical protein